MRRWGIASPSLCVILFAILFFTISLTSCTKSNKASDGKAELLHKTLPGEMFVGDFNVRVVPRMVAYPGALPILALKDDVPPDKELLGWFKPKAVKALPKININRDNNYGGLELMYQKGWEITGGAATGVIHIYDGTFSFLGQSNFGHFAVTPSWEDVSETEAISAGEDFIRAHGGIPKDAADVQANPSAFMVGPLVNDHGKWVRRDVPIVYTISYGRTFNTIPLESDRIAANVSKTPGGKYSVNQYSRMWHKISPDGEAKQIIEPGKAIEIAVKHFAPYVRAKSGIVASGLELVYYDPVFCSHPESSNRQPGNKLRPGWRVRVTGWNSIVDAYTGEIQGDEWGPKLGFASIKAMQKFENEPLSAKIPVPVRITLIKNGKAVRHWGPDDRQFGTILHEAQNILSKMRPHYKKKADMTGASSDTPLSYPKGGLLLEYGRSNVFFVTDSKLGRDMDKEDFPRDGSCRLEFTRDGYYRIYGDEAFICFNQSLADYSNRTEYNKKIYSDDPFTKILINTGSPRYMFTGAVASNDKLKELVNR